MAFDYAVEGEPVEEGGLSRYKRMKLSRDRYKREAYASAEKVKNLTQEVEDLRKALQAARGNYT